MTKIESREIIGYYTAAALVFALLALALLILRPFEADAHDRGQFAQSSPEIRQWFNGLHSGKGPCCSNAAAVQPVGVSSVVEMPGDPARMCGTCEHFDLGSGTCHNGISGRLTTTAPETCVKGWYPCTTRWPLHKRMGITG